MLRTPPPRIRRGFTLVEMLVATALVVLMLLLFAQVFGAAVGTMREQRSMAANDQNARAVETVLRSDLSRATSRQPRSRGAQGLIPLSRFAPVDAERQRGFLAISENDVENPADDVLSLTIDTRRTDREDQIELLRGRGRTLGRPGGAPDENSSGNPDPLATDFNQPDLDDGVYGNHLGESHMAEVVYFVRNGNLYRRQLMLREPALPRTLPSYPTAPSEYATQPGIGVGGAALVGGLLLDRKFMRDDGGGVLVPAGYVPVLDGAAAPAGAVGTDPTEPGFTGVSPGLADFWHDFDYSAWSWWRDLDGDGARDSFSTDQYWLMFNGAESLQTTPGATPFPIARPEYRFGHVPRLDGLGFTPGALRNRVGQPLEYLLSGLAPLPNPAVGFIGRFTHEETSHPLFGYPGVVPEDGLGVAGNPMLDAFAAAWDANGNGIIDAFEGGPRAAEELILTGVESFDIEVWDDGFVEFDIDGDGLFDGPRDLNGDGDILDPGEECEDANRSSSFGGAAFHENHAPRWVNLGHGPAPGLPLASEFEQRLGWFRHNRNQNRAYGPRLLSVGTDGAAGVVGVDDNRNGVVDDVGELGAPYSDDVCNRSYDTWHPRADIGGYHPTPALRSIDAPYGGYRIRGFVGCTRENNWQIERGHIVFPGVPSDKNFNRVLDTGEDADGDGRLDPGEDLNGNNALDPPETSTGPGGPDIPEDLNGNGIFDDLEDLNGNGVFDPGSAEDFNGNGTFDAHIQEDWSYYYRVVGYLPEPGDADGDGTIEWEDDNFNGVFDPGEDDDSDGRFDLEDPDQDGVVDIENHISGLVAPEWPREPGATVIDGGVIWQCVDNRVGLPMVRLTIRFRETASGLPRQVSIVHSFVE